MKRLSLATRCAAFLVLCTLLWAGVARAAEADPRGAIQPQDWPSYNRDVLGWRFNPAEKTLSPSSAHELELKWRFPPQGADFEIGAVHGTPVVVNGYVYFGTANKPAFYKLTPDGQVKWAFKLTEKEDRALDAVNTGMCGSALVTEDGVYFATVAGFVYSLDRFSGKERWRVDTRGEDFPGAHQMNGTLASPILADGKIILAGGALEQVIKAIFPAYRGHTGRGFVMALDPADGLLLWKYDVGPKPEKLDPPLVIKDAWGEHEFHFGPASSTIWSTPSYDAATNTIFFGTDACNAPRKSTKDDPRLDTKYACACVAIDARDGREKWVTQINPGDVWNTSMRAYDPEAERYLDQSIGDTPKVYSIDLKGQTTKVVGFGCKNGGFYVLRADDGRLVDHTPLYKGKPQYPLDPAPDARMLALPSPIGGLQTGCATDGQNVFTNGIDALLLGTTESPLEGRGPTGGRVTSISLDARHENWRHERPKLASLGGPPPLPVTKDAGDPVASGIAAAGGVLYFTTLASNKLVALDAASGKLLREIDLPPVWSGPSVSRGRVYVGSGNIVIPDLQFASPQSAVGVVFSFGLSDEDEVDRMGAGSE